MVRIRRRTRTKSTSHPSDGFKALRGAYKDIVWKGLELLQHGRVVKFGLKLVVQQKSNGKFDSNARVSGLQWPAKIFRGTVVKGLKAVLKAAGILSGHGR